MCATDIFTCSSNFLMGSSEKSRGKRRAQSQSSNCGYSDNFRNFKTLFPVIQSPEGMKPPVLRNLYRLLAHLSLNAQWIVKYSVGSLDPDLEICHDGIKVTFGDVSELFNILFKELEEKFEQLSSNLRGSYTNKDLGECSSNLGLFDDVEVMTLQFRCCLMLLILLEAKLDFVLEKGLILLRIVRKLSLPDLAENAGKRAFVFEKSFFRESAPCDNGCSTSSVEAFTSSLQFLGPSNPLLFFMPTMLEVFVDELLAHGILRGYFTMINYFASTDQRLFNPHSAQDIEIVTEVLCNHFILSFSDKQAFGDFLGRLFCTHAMEHKYPFRAPALSITTSVSLLLSPIMVSIPKYMQAHLISLVSESFHERSSKPDRKLTNYFLSSFEKSVDLYMTRMSRLVKDGYPNFPMEFKSVLSRGIAYPPFEFCVSPETENKVYSLIAKLDNLADVISNDISFRMKSDLVSSSMRFMKDCVNVYSVSSQDEILAILGCLVRKASESYDDKEIRLIDSSIIQNLYLLASLLKLIGISLLQAISCLRYNDDDSSCPKTLKDFASCKEYDFVLDTFTCFGDLHISLPLQQDLADVMSTHSRRHVRSKMMFLHFLGLMSLSFEIGLDCLVKGCLLVILGVLNLFVFEEGGLDAFQSLVDSNEQHFSSGLQETAVDQNCSLVVASKFQKMRSLCLSVTQNKDNENETQSLQNFANASSDMEAVTGLEEEEEETEETSNGEIFLKCMLKMGENSSNVDDLVDFVECKQGKDYSAWLKNRKRYRKWKFEKMAVLRWKRKKKAWKTGKRRVSFLGNGCVGDSQVELNGRKQIQFDNSSHG